MEPDKISLGLKDNADLASAFAGAGAGDTVTMKITFIIDEAATDMVVGSISDTEDVEVKEGPDDKDSDENASPEDASSDIGRQNVLAVMAPGSKNK